MNDTATSAEGLAAKEPSPASHGFVVLSGIALLANGILAIRLVWEQTALTWRDGPQMVGFSLAHGLWFPLLMSPLLIPVIGIWGIAHVVRSLRARRRPSPTVLAALGIGAVVVSMLIAPYSFWQRAFIGRLMAGPAVGEFVTSAAATGDLKTVAAFLDRGVSVDITGRYGTALHAAAVGKQPRIVEYLLARGAAVNALDPDGDSPLEDAVTSHSDEAARILEAHGARRIRGTQQQRDSVSAAQVKRDIDKMDARIRP